MANSIQQANEPTLSSILELHKEEILCSINCHQVGEIVSFDPSTQTAEVQIKMLRMMNGELKSYPVLIDCPCIILGGGEGRITFPIKAGDGCLVLFNDKDIDNWYAGGQTMQPRTDRQHNFADAIALVGVRNLQNKITDYFSDGVELKHGNSSIKLKDGYIDIKGNVNIVQNTVDDNSLHAYIISSYHNGANWYRVYSDGWCEQGGTSSGGAAVNYTATVVFSKQFINTDYTLLTQAGRIDNSPYNINNQSFVYSKSTTGFTAVCYGDGVSSFISWEAKGYIK